MRGVESSSGPRRTLAGPGQAVSGKAPGAARSELRAVGWRGIGVDRFGSRMWGWPTPAPSGPSSRAPWGPLRWLSRWDGSWCFSATIWTLPVRLLSWGRGCLCPPSLLGVRFEGVREALSLLSSLHHSSSSESGTWEGGGSQGKAAQVHSAPSYSTSSLYLFSECCFPPRLTGVGVPSSLGPQSRDLL